MNYNQLLSGPFGLNLPEKLQYGKLLPYFLSVEEKNDYEKNCKKLGNDWHYYNKEIIYNLNSNFYRAPEWNTIDWKQSIVVLGCSHVFGEGLATDETVCYQLEKLYNRPVINLGQSGTSTLFSWHNSIRLFELFGIPYAVINLWTDYSRLLYYDTDQIKRVGFWSGGRWDNYDRDMKSLYRIWNKNDIHAINFFKFEATACKEFWNSRTNYYEGSYFKETAEIINCDFFSQLDDARDFIHSGPITHKTAAGIIYENFSI